LLFLFFSFSLSNPSFHSFIIFLICSFLKLFLCFLVLCSFLLSVSLSFCFFLHPFVTSSLLVSFNKHFNGVLQLVGVIISFSGRSPTLADSPMFFFGSFLPWFILLLD
jgi:hypothetical protein